MKKKYVFKAYDKRFPVLFAKEKRRIASKLEATSLVEHVGSTAVPNLGGKGIIDIAIIANPENLDMVSNQLQDLGYEFRPQHSTPDRLFFRQDLADAQEGTRRYHIHLMRRGSNEWDAMIAFRDYLRAHPDEANQYATLKKKAAEEADEDGVKYRALKDPMFEKISKAAKRKQFTFKLVDMAHRSLVRHWLTLPHVTEWFYGQGLANTLKHLDEFLKGASEAQYWLAYDQDQPFAFLITSYVGKSDAYARWCTQEGDVITLDMLIGDLRYIGKGLAHLLIREFLVKEFPQVAEVLIDPEATNSRAIHVYQKAGFTLVDEFIPSHSPHPHYMMRLRMTDL